MDHSFVLDEKVLKRVPFLFTLIMILLLGFPAIALVHYGVDFNTMASELGIESNIASEAVAAQIRGYFVLVILQWSAFSLAIITLLLAFTKYKLTSDKIAFLIGLNILISGSLDVIHTLITDGFTSFSIDKDSVDALIWTFTNSVTGFIFIAGLVTISYQKNKPVSRLSTIIFPGFLLLLFGLSIACCMIFMVINPSLLYTNTFIHRPYELIDLSIYLSIIFIIYPKIYKKFPNILTNCIVYMSIAQIAIAIYLMVLPISSTGNAYDIAYYLKIIVYFIPLSCLIINYVFSYHSILQAQNSLQKDQEKLKFIASHDPLTKLFNRLAFENLLEINIANCLRDKNSFVILMIDIDNFKEINDNLGHIYGDHFLVKFSEQLDRLTRKGDIVARMGGDEFTVMTSKINAPKTAAKKMAERIINGFSGSHPDDELSLTNTVSIGIAIYPDDGETALELINNADMAMYHAKRSGKNTFCFYSAALCESEPQLLG